MEVFKILREYSGIDSKINSEVTMIRAGKEFAQELLPMIRECPEDAAVLKKTLADLKLEMRGQELDHLLEYRRLMQLKLNVLSAFNHLSVRSAAILQARACMGTHWAEIAATHKYSISQVKRFYCTALKRFALEYKDDL